MASSWAWVMVPLATSGSRADLAQSPLGAAEPVAGAAGTGAGVVVEEDGTGSDVGVVGAPVVVVLWPPEAAVGSVVELVSGSAAAPASAAAEASVLLVTSAIRV